ncbi:mucin-2-like [Littorina saxatilis]|uniref:mucin-2-like n=1 Tax=Littorina saxatilis TaxID=31220 RepID=UPI0038B46364
MATAPPPRTRRLCQLRLDPSKIAGNATPTVQDTKIPASRTNSSSSDHVDSVTLTLKLHRETDEGLGMVLGVEETVIPSGSSTTSGRSVIVKSVTAGSAAAGAVSTTSSGSDVSKNYDVSDCGFRVGDRVLRIDEFVLDDLEDDDCLTVLQDIPEVCTVVVQRTVASARSPTSPNASSSSSSRSTNLSSLSMTSSSPSPSSINTSSRSSAPSTTTATTPSTFPRTSPRTITKEPSHSSSATTNPTTLPRASRASLKTTAKDDEELPFFPKPTPSSQMPRPPPRKVRRQMSTAAHLAEKGLPGFQVRRVTFRRDEGQTLGLSIVPSFGATKFYYQVKRLLPTGVCAQSQRIEIGDRFLECNGQSLQNLTQAQCLDVLKAAAPKVTLTLLREIEIENENGDTVGVDSARTAKGKAEEDAAEKLSSRVPRETEIADDFGVQKGSDRSGQRVNNGADVDGDEHTTSSKSTQDGAVTKQFTSRNNSRYRPPSDKPGDTSSDTMSDPDLDPPTSFGAEEEGRDARVEPSQKQQQHNGNPDSASKTTPLDQDLLGGDGSGDGWSQSSMTQASNATAPYTLIDLPSGLSDSRSDGLLTEDILLDVSDTEMGEVGGQQPLTPTSSGQANGGGGLDLLCGDDAQFGESDVNIPPPMAFSDTEAGRCQPAAGSGPVTNIDDLLGMDFTATAASPAATDSRIDRASSGSSSGSDNFDFLLDVNEAKEEVMLADIAEEEPPRRPSGPPPPVPSGPPPPVPTDSATAEDEGENETDTAPSFKTSVFLPSENPLDNVTQISLNNDATTANSNNNTVHVTDITVTSFNSNVSAINVMRPKPAPRGGGGDSNGDNKASPRGSTVVTVDNSSAPTNTTQIHFDNSTNMTVVKATPPLNAFLPTSMGITKTVKPKPPKQEGEEEEEEEEEVIQPMTVHRDHQGNKLAAPSPPETLGRQSFAPKKFDEEARRDLQKILGDMEKTARPLPVRKTKYEDDDAPSVTEDEIVPVKLTRKEAEMAEDVLSKWISGGSKSDDSKPSSSPFSFAKKSGFQKMAGTVIDVQSGKVDLPTNSAFFTTIGVTRAAKPKMNGVEGEEAEEEAEEEITPMSVVKDHLGNKYYAPSPPESLGKKTGVRKLDSAAREDIAALLSGMSTSSSKPVKTSFEDKDSGVAEDEIVATVLTKEESRIALDAMQKWMSEDKDQPQAKPSPFQRLVGTVIDVAAKTDDNVDANETAEKKESKEEVSKDNNQSDSLVSKPVEEVVHRSETNDVSSTPPSEPEPVTAPEVTEKPPPATTSPKPPPPQVNAKPTMANRRNLFEQNNDDIEVTKPEPKSHSTRIDVGPKPTVTTLKRTELKPIPVPVPIQRAGLRGPVKLGTLSQVSSLSTKPLAKIGTLSVAHRSGSMPSLIGSKLSRVEYGKTRTDDSPFLVEVLKGIVGLGIKVKVNGQGHVEVTDVQKNSPVDKNGNVKVGDYLLSVNTTELTGQTDGRVQQVLRLLPRGLVKLVVSTQPPSTSATQGADSAGLSSPRAVGTYSQYGVRLAPQPFSPTSPDGPAPSLTATLPGKDPTPTTTSSSTPVTQPLTVSIGNEEEEEEEEEDEMSTRRLSKALSPRSGAQQNYHPEPTSPTSPTSPPRPTPRQRGNVPTSLSTPRNDSSADESQDAGEFSPRKAEHKMTASEAVAAASRRPSGRNGDLPQPQPLSPKSAAPQREEGSSSSTSSSPRVSSNVDPFLASARSPSGAMSPRDEELPVFVEAAKKVSPVPTPRPKPRLSSDGKQDEQDGSLSPRHNGHESPKPATRVKEELAEKQPEVVPVIVHAHAVTVINAAPPPAVASKPKIPPPVAPKPKRTSSMGSDKSGSSAQSDETPKDLPSPTLVASKLRDFADANAPTAKEQAQNRKVVSSAARMFEQKAAESKPVSPLTKPTKSSRILL